VRVREREREQGPSVPTSEDFSGRVDAAILVRRHRRTAPPRPELRKGMPARVGAGAVVVCGIAIGHHAMVGAGAVVYSTDRGAKNRGAKNRGVKDRGVKRRTTTDFTDSGAPGSVTSVVKHFFSDSSREVRTGQFRRLKSGAGMRPAWRMKRPLWPAE